MTNSLDDWNGARVTKRMFRAHVEDILSGRSDPKLTLSDAIKDFIWNEGGAENNKEFREMYRWAGAVFRQVKKESAEYQKLQADLRAKMAATTKDSTD